VDREVRGVSRGTSDLLKKVTGRSLGGVATPKGPRGKGIQWTVKGINKGDLRACSGQARQGEKSGWGSGPIKKKTFFHEGNVIFTLHKSPYPRFLTYSRDPERSRKKTTLEEDRECESCR